MKHGAAQIAAEFDQIAESLKSIGLTAQYPASVQQAIDLLAACFHRGNKVLVFGNGGSAADDGHICGELAGRFLKERRGLPAIALGANQALLTALGNDFGFDAVYTREIEALGSPGDVAWGISTSGNSPNVVNALRAAKASGLNTIGLTGPGGGAMAQFCDILMAAPVNSTPRIQEAHLITYHYICSAIEDLLFT
jgi:D-sedoheptulose 7-phosphate isomerase